MRQPPRERVRAAAAAGIVIAALVAASATWFVAAYLPIYPDEIAYRILTSRGFTDGLTVMNVYPTCVRSFTAPMPYSWVPAKALDFLLFGMIQDPTLLRAIGLATVGVAFGLALILFPVNSSPVRAVISLRGANRGLVVLLVSSLGIIPLSLVMTRPEGLALVLVLALAITHVRVMATQDFRYARWCVPPLFFLFMTWLYSLHPKMLFLAPLVLYLGWLIFRRLFSGAMSYLWIALLVGCIVEAYLFWRISYTCPENPAIQTYFHNLSLDPALVFSDPTAFFQQAGTNLANSTAYLYHAGFHKSYPIDWLPRTSRGGIGVLGKLANSVGLTALLWLTISVGTAAIKDICHLIRQRTNLPQSNIMALLIVVAVVPYAALNSSKHFYEVAFVWPMLAIAYGLQVGTGQLRRARVFTAVLAVAVIASAAAVASSFGREFISEGFLGKGISITRFSDSATAREVALLEEKCNIPRDAAGHFVVLDDVTYTYFSRTRNPVLITWLHVAAEGLDKLQYLRQMGSSGVITRCGYLPEPFRQRSLRVQFSKGYGGVADGELDLCCVAKERLNGNSAAEVKMMRVLATDEKQ